MTDVFISHAAADKPFVQRLAEDLRERGLSVWADESLPGGQRWGDVIEDAIRDSKNVLIVFSEQSNESEWLRSETALAISDGTKRAVPLILQHVTPPLLFRSIQGVDFSEDADYAPSLELLYNSLSKDVA